MNRTECKQDNDKADDAEQDQSPGSVAHQPFRPGFAKAFVSPTYNRPGWRSLDKTMAVTMRSASVSLSIASAIIAICRSVMAGILLDRSARHRDTSLTYLYVLSLYDLSPQRPFLSRLRPYPPLDISLSLTRMVWKIFHPPFQLLALATNAIDLVNNPSCLRLCSLSY